MKDRREEYRYQGVDRWLDADLYRRNGQLGYWHLREQGYRVVKRFWYWEDAQSWMYHHRDRHLRLAYVPRPFAWTILERIR